MVNCTLLGIVSWLIGWSTIVPYCFELRTLKAFSACNNFSLIHILFVILQHNSFYSSKPSAIEKKLIFPIILLETRQKLMKLQRYFDSYSGQFRAHVSNYGRFDSYSRQPQNFIYNIHTNTHTHYTFFAFSLYLPPDNKF